MSLSGLLDIARSGLLSQSGALGITGQNVTNATMPGYTKRVASLTPQVGGGVTFNGEIRSFDRFAYAHVVQQTGLQSAANARANALAGIEAIMAPTVRVHGTLRSIWPSRITSIMPVAMMPRKAPMATTASSTKASRTATGPEFRRRRVAGSS